MICSFLPDCYQKYITANAMFSSDFKLYDPSIPKFLHDRPHYFVKHCMQRYHAAKLSYTSIDVIKQTTTSFCVKSATSDGRNGNSYRVELGNSSLFPKCECADFKRHYLPCKHFFAVFQFEASSWKLLPDYFINSPFITIDHDSLPSGTNKASTVSFASSPSIDQTSDTIPPGTTTADVLPTNVSVSELSQRLRSNLKLLTDFSYICRDPASLENINKKVEELLCHCKSSLPAESGLTLLPSPAKKRKICTPSHSTVSKKISKLRPLPLHKRKRKLTLFEKYKNRVGRFADTIKAASTSEESNFVLLSSKTMANRKYRHQRALKIARLCLKKKRKDKLQTVHQGDCQDCSPSVDIQITGYTKTAVNPYKKRTLNTDEMLTILDSTNWLSDQVVNSAQNLLRSTVKAPGLYDTSLGPYLTYPQADNFSQILHDTNHWVLVSTIGCQQPHVKLFDSFYNGKISAY